MISSQVIIHVIYFLIRLLIDLQYVVHMMELVCYGVIVMS